MSHSVPVNTLVSLLATSLWFYHNRARSSCLGLLVIECGNPAFLLLLALGCQEGMQDGLFRSRNVLFHSPGGQKSKVVLVGLPER